MALLVGLLYAAVSVYWGLGGTWLLNTVGGSLEKQGRAGHVGVMFAVWAAVVLKVIAAGLPLVAVRRLTSPAWNRAIWMLAWIEAGILAIYGLVLTTVGLLVQAGVIHASATADHRALAWHAYLWDPWFLIWGLLVAGALLRGRYRRHQAVTDS
jgi:hypothetical protein